MKRILLATDGSEHALGASKYLADWMSYLKH